MHTDMLWVSTMSELFGLPEPTAQVPRYVARPKSMMPMASSWFATYRHDPTDKDALAFIPIIGIATVDIEDTVNSTVTTIFRPFVLMPSGNVVDATSLEGFVCLVSDDQSDLPEEEHIKEIVESMEGLEGG